MEKMLAHFGFKSIRDVMEKFGFYCEIDARRFLKEIYEEDTAE